MYINNKLKYIYNYLMRKKEYILQINTTKLVILFNYLPIKHKLINKNK